MSSGISDIGIYIPDLAITIEDIIKYRKDLDPKLARKITGASRLTGQTAIRFPYNWEDSVTFAAETIKALDKRNPGVLNNLRYFGAGTETTVDFSKPIPSYVSGVLEQSGIILPHNISTFQTQHACASGTIAMQQTLSQLNQSDHPQDTGLISCTDIAHYKRNTTAEITQGAGSVSLLLEKSAQLVEIDPVHTGYASYDVDDFFRPLGSITAKVKGQYSMKCYQDSLVNAVDDYCRRLGISAHDVLPSMDYFVCHAPFSNMPKVALRYLLEEMLGLDYAEAEQFTMHHAVNSSNSYISSIGNLYSGAVYFNLAVLLYNEWKRIGTDICGKKILFASYGSGNTMIVFTGRIAETAVNVIKKWDIESILDSKSSRESYDLYEKWLENKLQSSCSADILVPSERFYLKSVREDGYHEYGYKP